MKSDAKMCKKEDALTKKRIKKKTPENVGNPLLLQLYMNIKVADDSLLIHANCICTLIIRRCLIGYL